MKLMKKSLFASILACAVFIGTCPAHAIVPDGPGYTQGTEAGGSVSTDVSINIPGSGGSGGTGEGDDSGSGSETGDETGDGQDPAQYKYKIYYYYDDSVQRDFGYGPLGFKTPYRLDTPLKYAGSNWILDTFDVAEYITEVEEDNVSTVYYTKDDLDKDGNPVEGGDGIPDKYQDPDNLISTLESYGYNVTYDYLDKEAMTSNGTQSFSGAASLGSAIPYSMPNVRTFEAREYRLNSVAASSYTITPEAEKNTIELTYVSMEENEKADKVPTTYLVTFDPDNGNGIDTVHVEEGKAVSAPAAPVKDGYGFLYWAYPETTVTSETETILGDDGAMHEVTVEKSKTTYMQYDFSSPVESNLGLKAIYEVESGMVEYEVRHYTQALEEGAYMEYLLAETEKKIGKVGASVTAAAKSYAGFVLDAENPSAIPSGTAQEGLVLALYYNRTDVNVTIDPDNGGEATHTTVKAGSMIPVPETPAKDGYAFDGWVSDGKPFVFTTPVKTDITITATWHTLGEETSYTVEHYKETQNGSYELADREVVMSRDGANVNAETKDYPGFVENWQYPDRVSYGQVSATTPLVLRLYYDHSDKSQATCEVPTAKTDLVYNGNPQELVNPGSTTDGTIKYSLSKDGPWSEDVPTGIESGSYDVYYYVEGDDDHENSDVMGPVSVVVEPCGNIDVKVTNYAPTKASWEAPTDGWITGSNMFTVTSNMACAVALVRDGEVAVLSCEHREANTYAFMAELTDGDEIVIVLVGDSDLDGRLTVADLVCLSRHLGGMRDLSACAALAADTDLDGNPMDADLVCLSRYFGVQYETNWRLKKQEPEPPALSYALNIAPIEHGSVVGSGFRTDANGIVQELPEVTCDEGYKFSHWVADIDGETVTIEVGTQLTEDVTLKAVLLEGFALNIAPIEHGSVSNSDFRTDANGIVRELPEITCDEGYRFSHWTADVNGESVTVEVGTQLTEDVTLKAVLLEGFALNIAPIEHGSVSNSDFRTDANGIVRELPEITCDEGYQFSHWTANVNGETMTVEVGTQLDGDTVIDAVFIRTAPIGTSISRAKMAEVFGKNGSLIQTLLTEKGNPDCATDISAAQDGTVLATLDAETHIGTIYQNNSYLEGSMANLFSGYATLVSADLSNLDTSAVTNMVCMFYNCSSLTSLDLSGFNTSAVTRMDGMFWNCSALVSLDLASFDTSTVTKMVSIFAGCNALTSLNLSSFNTSAVTDASYMFEDCSSLASLNLSSFNTSKVTDMSSMFSGCSKLTSLDLSNFNTSAVTNMVYMFNGCSKLRSLNVSNFDTSKVTNMSSMFYGCSSLASMDLSSFNGGATYRTNRMFYNCTSLTSLDLSGFDTCAITDMGNAEYMFGGCPKLKSIYVKDAAAKTKISATKGFPSSCTISIR